MEKITFNTFDKDLLPMVSIVIPVYNVEKYLAQCLDSVEKQTYSNIEIIVIDDGSTDRSGIICDCYAKRNPRIQVFHTNNNGLAFARNFGIKHVHGQYMLFVDSDDWVEERAVEVLLRNALALNADIVSAKNYVEYVNQHFLSPNEDNTIQIYRGSDILPAFINGMIGTVAWNKLYHANCIEYLKFPNGQNYEDVYSMWEVIKRLAENEGIIVSIPEYLFHFRMRKSSITHTKSLSNIVDCWNAYHRKYQALHGYERSLLPVCILSIGRMWINYFGLSKEEKLSSEKTIQEMKTFSQVHFHEVLEGNYGWFIKVLCIISQSNIGFLMSIYYLVGKVYSHFKVSENELYE